MKKLCFLLLAGFLPFIHAFGQVQPIKIASLVVKRQLPAKPETWASLPGAILLTATKTPGLQTREIKLVVQIRRGSSLVCGNNASSGMPIPDFNNRSFSAAELTGPLSQCGELKEGDYSFCAQFFDISNKPVSEEVCRDFTVVSAKPPNNYSRPVNIFPADKASLRPEQARVITFKWTPLVPPPPNRDLVYRIKVWQLMQGQNSIQAMRTNPPIVTKDVDNITQAIVNDLYTGPCRPPYLCDFVWTVQALNREGKPYGDNNGLSEPTTFAVTQYIIQLDSARVACTDKPGVYTFSYTLNNPNPGTARLTNFVATSSVPAGASVSSFAPPLNTNIPSGASLTITGTITGPANLSQICLGAEITDLANSFWKASKDTCIKVPPCACDACDEKKLKFNIPPGSIVFNNNNTLSLTQPITITTTPPKMVKSIKAELVYFEYLPASEDCLPCNKDSKTYGNFVNGTLATQGASGAGTHSLEWVFAPAKNFSTAQNAAFNISLPPIVACCDVSIRFCIRYIVTFDDCTVCHTLVCYEKKKTGGAVSNNNNNNNPK